MRTAAVALLNGWADPMRLMRLSPDDWLIASSVVMEAQRLRTERDRALADYVAAHTARQTARPIVKALARVNKTLVQALRALAGPHG
ncbi:hypothetical protein ACOACO_17430 [Nocardioides sp. CPCC 205120]|uniref:hypothetical protein n=1 Tax=Nocardioides sp. CPCC 205120 TaxID=3406462 RepID=UPI003B510BEC